MVFFYTGLKPGATHSSYLRHASHHHLAQVFRLVLLIMQSPDCIRLVLCVTDHSHIWIRFHSLAQTFVSHYALGPACPGEHSDIGKENGLFVFFYPGLKPLPIYLSCLWYCFQTPTSCFQSSHSF